MVDVDARAVLAAIERDAPLEAQRADGAEPAEAEAHRLVERAGHARSRCQVPAGKTLPASAKTTPLMPADWKSGNSSSRLRTACLLPPTATVADRRQWGDGGRRGPLLVGEMERKR